jgi:hypothetical protein
MFAKVTEITQSFSQKINMRLVMFIILLVMVVLGAGAPGATGV